MKLEYETEKTIDGKKVKVGKIGESSVLIEEGKTKDKLTVSGMSHLVKQEELKPIIDDGWKFKDVKSESYGRHTETKKPMYHFIARFDKPKKEKVIREDKLD